LIGNQPACFNKCLPKNRQIIAAKHSVLVDVDQLPRLLRELIEQRTKEPVVAVVFVTVQRDDVLSRRERVRLRTGESDFE
jgi:hypothetical protein